MVAFELPWSMIAGISVRVICLFVEFPKVKVVEQREYFKWRHGHPDTVIIKTEKTEEKEK